MSVRVKVKWKRVFDGCWHGFVGDNPNPRAIVDQNYFGRKLWTVEVDGKKKTDGSADCFSFRLAKDLVKRTLTEEVVHGRAHTNQLVGGPDLG